MDKTNGFAQIEHHPRTGEIIGLTFLQLALFRTDTNKELVGVFTHACVEGYCNMTPDNLKFYDQNWKDVSNEVIKIEQIKQSFDKIKTTQFRAE